MSRPDFDTVSASLAELASVLKARRDSSRIQKLARFGQSPVLSLSAAVSASLVSAAAHELDEDPLAGLVAVDDLSALSGEICLPGNAYASGDEHDHAQSDSALAHAGKHGLPFYLADPFASPYATGSSASHASHQARASIEGHGQSAHGFGHEQHSASLSGGAGRAGSHQHGAHQNEQAANQHAQHSPAVTDASSSAMHAAHSDDHVPHEAMTGHAGRQPASAPGNAHAEHFTHADEGHNMHAMAPSDDGLDALIDSLSQNSKPAALHHVTNYETVEASGPELAAALTPSTEATLHDHHGASLAAMDMPQSDDLSAAQTAPLI